LFSAIGKIGKAEESKNGNLSMKHALPRHFVAQTDRQKHLVTVTRAGALR
jgi:hypothetical protein